MPMNHRGSRPGPESARSRGVGTRLRPSLEPLEGRSLLSTFAVVNTNDSGAGSLRQAIFDANDSILSPGLDTIAFNIPGGGVKTIAPASALPDITDPVIIDGYTQPGASANTLAVGSDAVLLVELNGTVAGSSGLVVAGGGSTVRGLVINRFGGSGAFTEAGIFVRSDNNVIEGNFIGVDAAGSAELGNMRGVRVATGRNNLIGGTTPAARNVISGNGAGQPTFGNVNVDKLLFSVDPQPTGTIIRGNYIGTNAAGTAAVHLGQFGNTHGVVVLVSTGTIIGGSDADDGLLDGVVGARNVISGNDSGIHTQESSTTFGADLTVRGNFIGVDATGDAALGNFYGIFFSPPRDRNDNQITIGGTAAGAGNVISGNASDGVLVSNANVVMQGNRIGTNLAGILDLGNGSYGVELTRGGSPPFPSVQFTVGGTTPAARNIISGNGGGGLRVNNLSGTATVQGNYIGTQGDGTSALGNALDGIYAQTSATIGGTAAGEGNVIAYNGIVSQFGSAGAGVNVPSATGVTILGNSIFANGGLGIDLSGDGVTSNDPDDPDIGPNNLQNFPVITGVAGNAITATLNSVPSKSYRVEFFASAVADPSGKGEGQTFLGFVDVAAGGNTSTFAFNSPVSISGKFIAATATDADGNTSEFSAALQVAGNIAPVGNPDSYTVAEGGTSTTSDVTGTATPGNLADNGVLANDVDADGGTLTAVLATGPTHALSFTLNANGTFTYVHDGSETTSDVFTYMANDGQANSILVGATLTITPRNDAPSFTSPPIIVATSGVRYSYAIVTTDPDLGDTRAISAVTLPAWLTLTDNGDGTATLSGTPTGAQVGSHGVVLKVADLTGASANQAFTIAVATPVIPPAPMIVGNLVVFGTRLRDTIVVDATNPNAIVVTINGKVLSSRVLGPSPVPTSPNDTVVTNDASFPLNPAGAPYAVNPMTGRIIIYGLAGNDILQVIGSVRGEIHGGSGNDRLVGGAGDDWLDGGAGNNRLAGSSGADRLIGGKGNDQLSGGSGRDALSGGSGRDTLRTRDEVGDTLDGGPGCDKAAVDKRDSVSKDVERVTRRLLAAATAQRSAHGTIADADVAPLLREAIRRWQNAGVDVAPLLNVELSITPLAGKCLAQTSGPIIRLDEDAAGWGWFVDRTPEDDAEFKRPGTRGEQGRMDLLSTLIHELGHVLGYGHTRGGVMADTLTAGTRRLDLSSGPKSRFQSTRRSPASK